MLMAAGQWTVRPRGARKRADFIMLFHLVFLSYRDVPFFRVSFSPFFSRTGYQKKANFLEQVVKTCQKRKFCYNGLILSPIFVF